MDVSTNAALNTDRPETAARTMETPDSVQASSGSNITSLSEAKKTASLTTILARPSEDQKNEESQSQNIQLTRQDVEEMVEALEEFANTVQTRLNFSIDDGTEDIVVKILDKETDEIIKQFPAEEILELREKMQDLSGLLFSTNV